MKRAPNFRIKGSESDILWLRTRLEDKVFYGSPDGCHYWTGHTVNGRYGHIRFKETMVLAHRAAYTIYVGRIPDKMVVMHSCDNPLCVNPAHLSVGTQGDNIRDTVKKGRHNPASTFGTLSGRSTNLTDDDVRAIRKELESGKFQRVIGKKYGIRQPQISRIKNRLSWPHI